MKVDLDKDDLKRLVKQAIPRDWGICDECEKAGVMRFTGNQHNPSWTYEDSYLDGLSEESLWGLYQDSINRVALNEADKARSA